METVIEVGKECDGLNCRDGRRKSELAEQGWRKIMSVALRVCEWMDLVEIVIEVGKACDGLNCIHGVD